MCVSEARERGQDVSVREVQTCVLVRQYGCNQDGPHQHSRERLTNTHVLPHVPTAVPRASVVPLGLVPVIQ